MRQIGGDGWPFLTDGAVLARNADGLEIVFSHPVDPASVRQAIRVTRQDGQDPGWPMSVQGRLVTLTWPEHLPRADERYTISIAGTAGGIRDMLGQALPAPVTTTLQTDIWRFQADAGPLAVQLFSDWQPAIVRVVVTDEDRGTTLHGHIRGATACASTTTASPR